MQLLEFGALTMYRSLPPFPNNGPKLPLHNMAFPSFPAINGILVGGKPFGLTRLNRNESGALLYSPPAEANKQTYLMY